MPMTRDNDYMRIPCKKCVIDIGKQIRSPPSVSKGCPLERVGQSLDKLKKFFLTILQLSIFLNRVEPGGMI